MFNNNATNFRKSIQGSVEGVTQAGIMASVAQSAKGRNNPITSKNIEKVRSMKEKGITNERTQQLDDMLYLASMSEDYEEGGIHDQLEKAGYGVIPDESLYMYDDYDLFDEYDDDLAEAVNTKAVNQELSGRERKDKVKERKEMLKNNPNEFKERQVKMRMDNKKNRLTIAGQKNNTNKPEVKEEIKEEVETSPVVESKPKPEVKEEVKTSPVVESKPKPEVKEEVEQETVERKTFENTQNMNPEDFSNEELESIIMEGSFNAEIYNTDRFKELNAEYHKREPERETKNQAEESSSDFIDDGELDDAFNID